MAGNLPFHHLTLAQPSGKQVQPQVISKQMIDQISNSLRDQISQSIKDMKQYGTVRNSEPPHAQAFMMPLFPMSPQGVNVTPETQKKRGKKTTNKVVAEFTFSYRVPVICFQNNIDMDNSILYDESTGSYSHNSHKFPFQLRLQNWTLQQRERPKGNMSDVYYRHNISEGTFRSMKEVVKFMIYEQYPPKPSNEKKKKPEVGEGSASSGGRGKRKSDEEIDDFATQRERVEKFLAEARENLMNWKPPSDD